MTTNSRYFSIDRAIILDNAVSVVSTVIHGSERYALLFVLVNSNDALINGYEYPSNLMLLLPLCLNGTKSTVVSQVFFVALKTSFPSSICAVHVRVDVLIH